ncbi:MAG: sodium:solute symporter [Sedimentisphaerales bacterium]|nr:sodium:solute symporter [Sedimentisphaerales bacterium]
MNLHWLDIGTLSIYLVGIIATGIYFSRKNTSTEEYFVGGRSFAGWVVGFSLVGTSISSITFLAFPADSFKTAWLRYLPNLMLPVGIVIASYVYLPFFRRGKITSAYEYLEGRFGPSIRVYGAGAFIITQLVRLSMILYLLSLVLHEMLGLSPFMCILVGGTFVALYTIIGGIDAVIWTDVVQTLVLTLGSILCLGIIIHKLPGGLGQIFSVAIREHKFSLSELTDGKLSPVPWGFSLERKTVMMMFFLGLTTWLTEYSTNQNTIQRYCASKNVHEARKAMWVCVCCSLPIWTFYMFLGTSLFAFFDSFPTSETTEMLTGARKAEQVLPFFIMNYLPPGVTGLVIAAALAAAMSSLDSIINAVATVGIVDIYRRHLVKGREDKHYLKVAWIFASVAAAVMIGGAILLAKSDTKTLQDTATILASLFAGGLLGMYMLGFLTKKGDARAVGFGIGATILFTCWTMLSSKQLLPKALEVPFDLYYTIIIGNFVMFVVGFIAGTLLPKKKRDLTNLTVWTQDGTPLE